MTKAEGIATNPLATARQLWRLNKEGYLELRGLRTMPVSASAADAAIKLISGAGDGLAPARSKHS